jgi:hypothetical protein
VDSRRGSGSVFGLEIPPDHVAHAKLPGLADGSNDRALEPAEIS